MFELEINILFVGTITDDKNKKHVILDRERVDVKRSHLIFVNLFTEEPDVLLYPISKICNWTIEFLIKKIKSNYSQLKSRKKWTIIFPIKEGQVSYFQKDISRLEFQKIFMENLSQVINRIGISVSSHYFDSKDEALKNIGKKNLSSFEIPQKEEEYFFFPYPLTCTENVENHPELISKVFY